MMRRAFAGVALVATLSSDVHAQQHLVGDWHGSLATPAGDLTLVFRFAQNATDTLVKGDMESVNQAPGRPIPLADVRATREQLSFAIPSISARYEGTWNAAAQRWEGEFQQGARLTLVIKRGLPDSNTPPRRVRTQWPLRDKAYREEDVRIANTAAPGVTLAATLTIPRGNGPFPAVVLVTGSGPQDRDETIFGHKPFAVLAHHLSNNGIAVLRFDDRGYGASTGNHDAATSSDFASDVLAVVNYLESRPEVARSSIGVIGHSEGGLIGPIAATQNNRIAFLVLLAAPGTNTVQLSLSQRRAMGMSQGVSEEVMLETEPLARGLLDAVRTSPDSLHLVARLSELLTAETLGALGATEAQRDAIMNRYAAPWMRFFLTYDPEHYLSKLSIPILALGGSLDIQVPSAENLAGLRRILAAHKDATVRELPQLNHMFQTARTGAMGEYADLEETFAPVALDAITSWIRERFVP